jgi:hypothetical protein
VAPSDGRGQDVLVDRRGRAHRRRRGRNRGSGQGV